MATDIVDDPWNWTVDQVAQELTTTQRSWQPGTLSSPDLNLLRQSLRNHIVNGQVLLTQINHRKDVTEIFSIFVLNHQTWLLEAIRQFRLRSPQYLSQNAAPASRGTTELELNLCLRKLNEVIFGPGSPGPENPLHLPQRPGPKRILYTRPNTTVSPTTIPGTIVPRTLLLTPAEAASTSPASSKATFVDASGQSTGNEQDINIEQAFDEPAAKRLKASSTDPAGQAVSKFKGSFQDQETGADNESTLVPSPEPSTSSSPEQSVDCPNVDTEDNDQALVPSPDLITPLVPETEDELSDLRVEGDVMADTEDSGQALVLFPKPNTLMDPEIEAELPDLLVEGDVNTSTEIDEQLRVPCPGLSTLLVSEAGVELPFHHVKGDDQETVSQPEADLTTVQKAPKRLALGMLTQIGVIDPNRNRAVPSYGDDILVLDIPDPTTTVSHLIDTHETSNSPQVNPVGDDHDSDQSDVEAANQLLQENSVQAPDSDSLDTSAASHRSRPARPRRARVTTYLRKDALPVDDLFYKGVAFGANIPVNVIKSDDKYFSHTNRRKVPSGQIRYVSKIIRNFLLSKQDLDRTRRPSRPKFSTDLLTTDVLRDGDGKPIPDLCLDPQILKNNIGTPFVQEPEEESQPALEITTNEVAASKGSSLVLGGVQQKSAPEVVSEAPESGENQVEKQDEKDDAHTLYTAVRTYHEGKGNSGLMTWLSTPSFTLYYTTEDGEVRARREKLIDWPELMGENDPNDFVALSPLELIGSRPVPPPEYYLHWEQKYIGGQDELLPVVAKSDAEDNPATHEEQQYSPRRRIERGGTQLSPPQLKYIFDQAIEKFIEKFQVQNLPTLNAKAYRVWIDSRRTRTKRIQIRAAQNDIQTLEARIASHRAKFLLVPWSSSVQALKGCRNTEPTVIDIQFLKWKIDTLGQKTCPDKPDPPQSKSFLRKKARAPLAAQEAGDVANNGVPGQETEFDDDDDLEGFIVSDEESDEEDGREEEQRVDDMEDSEDDLEEIDRSAKSSSPLDKSVMDTTHTPSDASEVASTPVRKSKITKAISKVIDLTESPPSAAFSANTTAVIDLTTPEKNSTTTPKGRKLMLTNRSISPLAISSGSVGDLPPYDNPIAIAEFPYEFWEKAGDADRLLIRVLYKLQDPQSLLRFFERYSEEQLWEHLCKVMMALQTGYDNVDGMKSRTFNHLTEIVQLGNMFMSCKFHKWGEELPSLLLKILRNSKSYWYHRFYKLCSCMDGYLNASSSPEPSSPSPLAKARKSTKRQITESDEDDEGPTKRRRIRNAADTDDDDVPVILSPHSTRKRPVVEDADAREARARNKERLDEQARRRAILKAKLAESGMTLGQGKTKHIINDAAALEQGHIHVNEEIGHRIKQHQVDGVRFMWNQVVAVTNEGAMQGCLLAHTMGLGKTMQVITLLVAIAEAASSPDPTISSQIPSSLKGTSRTLVLCPPGLIDNWMDELLFWTPGNTLGDFWKLSSTLSVKDRLQTISDWHGAGGVLIVGYEMLRNLVQNKAITNRQAPLTEVEHKRVLEELLSGPDIIIADEAHKLKNAKSSLASAASQFRSKCRIALTGSPLANNVEEYHSMIEFVQPGYLGDVVEFRVKYKEPIEAGLFADSADTDRREALKKLGVLNKELALKVNRADLSVLRNDLPPKKEFVMSVPLTDIQRKVYTLYVQSLQVDDTELTKDGEVKQATLWSWLATLSLLCNHPYCFNTKIQEGKADLPKADTLDNDALDDNVTAQLLDVPLSKAGLTTAFAEEVTRLFAAEDLTQTNLSNKVVVLCQILDAAKSAGDKTLVFSSSIPTLDFLEKLFMGQGRSLARLDGKTPIAKRQRLIKTFNSGNQEVFLISTTAGGLGLNLQSANRVVIFDFKYNPIQEEQAVGRAYRIGQLKPTFVYRFVCGGTFEDNVHNKTVFKSQLASRVVDKKSPLAYAKKKFGDFLFKPKDLPQQDLSEFQGMDPAVLDKILASQAQIATIRSIVQTDTFEMDDEDRLTPEEQQEVDRMIRELDLRRNNPIEAQRQAYQMAQSKRPNPSLTQPPPSMIPQAEAQRHITYLMQNGPSTISQANTQRPEQPPNSSIQPTTPRSQLTGSGSLGTLKQTPILPPPSRYPPGSFRVPSSQAGRSSQVGASSLNNSGGVHSDSASIGTLPIMRANSRYVLDPDTPSRYQGHEQSDELRRATRTSGVLEPGSYESTPRQSMVVSNANSGSSQSKPQTDPGARLYPVLVNAYMAGGSVTPPGSDTSGIPSSVHKRTQDVADKIKAAVHKRFPLGADREQRMASAFAVLRNNPKMCHRLIDSELSADEFVQGLSLREIGSDSQNSAMFLAMNGQFSRNPVQNLKTPVNHQKNRKRNRNVNNGNPSIRDDDARAMAKVDLNRLAKGTLPVSRPHKDGGNHTGRQLRDAEPIPGDAILRRKSPAGLSASAAPSSKDI